MQDPPQPLKNANNMMSQPTASTEESASMVINNATSMMGVATRGEKSSDVVVKKGYTKKSTIPSMKKQATALTKKSSVKLSSTT